MLELFNGRSLKSLWSYRHGKGFAEELPPLSKEKGKVGDIYKNADKKGSNRQERLPLCIYSVNFYEPCI